MQHSRRTATFIVARWLQTHEFPSGLLPETGADRAFVQDLVYTVIRRLRTLRSVLGILVPKWPKGELEALLYVGAAQVLFMEDVPDFAAVHETVEAAKYCKNVRIPKVVNGVLRNLLRRREEFLAHIAAAPLAERESFPTELVRRWETRYGADCAARLCAWHNRPAETFLARPDGSFTVLPRGRRVADEPGYGEGAFIVQDPATALAVSLLAPMPGETVLDACAAPGGKTIQIAWRGASVVACEVNAHRRAKLAENIRRVRLADRVTIVPTFGDAHFDKVLVDAPCSNTGVFRRRPDARWNWSLEKLADLVRLQGEILDRAAACVAEGGTLVYATCSNEPEENLGQVEAFLKRHPGFACEETRESLPAVDNQDGAFAAALVRRAPVGGLRSQDNNNR